MELIPENTSCVDEDGCCDCGCCCFCCFWLTVAEEVSLRLLRRLEVAEGVLSVEANNVLDVIKNIEEDEDDDAEEEAEAATAAVEDDEDERQALLNIRNIELEGNMFVFLSCTHSLSLTIRSSLVVVDC